MGEQTGEMPACSPIEFRNGLLFLRRDNDLFELRL